MFKLLNFFKKGFTAKTVFFSFAHSKQQKYGRLLNLFNVLCFYHLLSLLVVVIICFLCPTNGRKKQEVTDTVYAYSKKTKTFGTGRKADPG